MGKDALHTGLIEETESPIPLLPADDAWAAMQSRLDEQLPVRFTRWSLRKFWWYGGAGLLLMAGIVWMLLQDNVSDKKDQDKYATGKTSSSQVTGDEQDLQNAVGRHAVTGDATKRTGDETKQGPLTQEQFPAARSATGDDPVTDTKQMPLSVNSPAQTSNAAREQKGNDRPPVSSNTEPLGRKEEMDAGSSKSGTNNINATKAAKQGGGNGNKPVSAGGAKGKGNKPFNNKSPDNTTFSQLNAAAESGGNDAGLNKKNKGNKKNGGINGSVMTGPSGSTGSLDQGQTDSGRSASSSDAAMDSLQRHSYRSAVWTQVLSPVDLTSKPAISEAVKALPDKMGQQLQPAVRPKPLVAWSAGLQLQLRAPLAGTDLLLKGPDGTDQPFSLLMPSAFFTLRYKKHSLTVEATPRTQDVVRNGTFSTITDDSNQVSIQWSLQKTFGWGASIVYRYELLPHLNAGIGIQMNRWNKGLALFTVDSSGNSHQQYYAFNKDDSTWNVTVTRQWKAAAELWYERRRWAVGIRMSGPLTRPLQDVPGNASNPAQFGLLFRWKILPEKRYW